MVPVPILPILPIIGGIVTAIGVASNGIKIFQFGQEQFGKNQPSPDVVNFAFKIGIDGAGANENGQGGLGNAGGNIPDIRVFNEVGRYLGRKINDKTYCGSGQDNCMSQVGGVNNQPTYTLFSGNDNAICIAWIGVTFPGGDRYAWVGNWGQQCNAPWYYSDIYVQSSEGSEKVMCTWLDKNGDAPLTALQIHWPEFKEGFRGVESDPNYYCQSQPSQIFYYDGDKTSISYWGPGGIGRTVFKTGNHKRSPSVFDEHTATSPVDSHKDRMEKFRRSQANDGRLIKSPSESHSALELCGSESSVGPSFVSLTERLYCDMSSKTTYPFCDDIGEGACWGDDVDSVVWKGEVSEANAVKRAAMPESKFDKVIHWSK